MHKKTIKRGEREYNYYLNILKYNIRSISLKSNKNKKNGFNGTSKLYFQVFNSEDKPLYKFYGFDLRSWVGGIGIRTHLKSGGLPSLVGSNSSSMMKFPHPAQKSFVEVDNA